MNWSVKASPHFWRTALPLKEKYTHEQFASIIRSIREAICELAARGRVEESGWHDHPLERSPFGDGNHFEFHTFDDDTIGALTANFRTQRNQEVRGIDDFRFTRCVFNNRGTFRQGCSTHDGHRCANADFIHHDMCAFQTTIDGSFNVTFFQFDGRA